jgi:hypothetical protein
MISKLGKDPQKLDAGLQLFRSLPELDRGASTITIYRATGRKSL